MKYTAEISGSSWSRGPVAEFATIKAARRWAEEYGSTADACTIRNRRGRTVALHRRDPSRDRWYLAVAAD